ncbi:hypothetical protein ACWEV7_39875, partial [Streptomyces sp. NPDC003952]
MTHPLPSGLEPDRLVLPSPRHPDESFRPVLLDLSQPADAAALVGLRDSDRLREVHDRIEDQVDELLRCRAPQDAFGGRSRSRAIADTLGSRPDAYGRWAWYPWSGRLVHVLPEGEFRQVRTDRNRDKITREQQQGLRKVLVGPGGPDVAEQGLPSVALQEWPSG